MAKQTIGIGTTANDGTGDQLRDAFDKTNDNIDEIYGTEPTIISITDMNAGDGTPVRTTAPATLAGAMGDTAGMIALDATPGAESVYVCFETYVAGPQDIWIQITPADIVTNAADIVTNGTAIGTNATNIATNLASINDINLGLGTVARSYTPATSVGVDGDLAGMVAWDATYIYVCKLDWDNASDIWDRVALLGTTW